MSQPTVEFFYDYSSPWTYLAFDNIEELCRRQGAPRLEADPYLGDFQHDQPSVYELRANPVPAKVRYMKKDLGDWARHQGVAIRFPPRIFPVNSLKALRGAFFALEQGMIGSYSERVFRVYFGEDLDISCDDVLEVIIREVVLDPGAFAEAIGRHSIKDRLRENSEECIRGGGFGSPTSFLGDDIHFGNYRLPLVEAALRVARR